MKNPAALPVVAAIIQRDGRILAAKRPANKHLGLKWEFPGGKIEKGEKAEDAILREIREELGCELVLGRALPRYIHHYETVTIEMIPFCATLKQGTDEPHPHEHAELRWVKYAELTELDLAEADWPIVDALAES